MIVVPTKRSMLPFLLGGRFLAIAIIANRALLHSSVLVLVVCTAFRPSPPQLVDGSCEKPKCKGTCLGHHAGVQRVRGSGLRSPSVVQTRGVVQAYHFGHLPFGH